MGSVVSIGLLIFISVAVVVFLISIIISIKFGKKTSFNASHKDNSFGFSIESDDQDGDNCEKNKEVLLDENQTQVISTPQANKMRTQDHLRMALFQSIRSHFIFTTGFGLLLFKDNIADKIYIKYFKRIAPNKIDLNLIDINDKYIEYLFKIYVEIFRKFTERMISVLDQDINGENVNTYPIKLTHFNSCVEDMIKDLTEGKYAKTCLTNFKSEPPEFVLRDGSKHKVTAENMNKELLQEFHDKLKLAAMDLIHDLRMSLSGITYSDIPITNLYSILSCVLHILDSIERHLFDIQFQGKVSILGKSLGV